MAKYPRPAVSQFTEADKARFYSKIDRSDPSGCHPWLTTAQSPFGYGNFRKSRTTLMAHRVAYQLHHGVDLASGQLVCHTCDNPKCCNPDHLWVGSIEGNVADREFKHRGRPGKTVGTAHYLAKLTPEAVWDIRRTLESIPAKQGRMAAYEALGAKYGTSPTTIRAVIKGQNWAHVK
jgi:hypothetical protein